MLEDKGPQNHKSVEELIEDKKEELAKNAAEAGPEPEAAESETAEPEAKPEEKPEGEEKDEEPEEEKKSRGGYLKSQKFRRGSISTAFTAGFIAVVVLLNVLVGILGQKFPSINLDLTKTSTNSLSAQSEKVIDSVKTPTTVTICATQQQVQNDQIYAENGLQYSQVGSLAAKIAERNSNIKVQYVDLDKNPAFANDYKSDNLTAGDVIVKTDKRYRVLAYNDLFDIETSQDGSSQQVYSNVDGAFAGALSAVISDKLPIVAFDTGHTEKQDMSAYKKLLSSNSFDTKDFNLLTDAIPSGAQMIVLGYPTTDLSDAEVTKLSQFLASKTVDGDRSLMLTFYPDQGSMPKLENFLKEWGLAVPQAVIVETNQQKYLSEKPQYLLSDVQSTLDLTGKAKEQQSGQTTDYGYFFTPVSNPINILYQSKGTRATYSLAKTSSTCYLVDNNTKEGATPPQASYNTVALSQDTVTANDKTYKSNVIAVGSSLLLSDGVINSSTFGNGKYMADLSKYATGTTAAANALNIPVKEMNATDITLNSALAGVLGLGIFTVLIPLSILIAGLMIYNKRRRL
jgi:ABC-2 type transport system permease protein